VKVIFMPARASLLPASLISFQFHSLGVSLWGMKRACHLPLKGLNTKNFLEQFSSIMKVYSTRNTPLFFFADGESELKQARK